MNPPRGHFSVSRGLEGFDRRFGEGEVIAAAAARGEGLRLLEIGCGEGRALLELRRLFPLAELHGINREPWEAMQGSESLAEVAQFHGIFTSEELTKVELPTIHFLDARELPFADGSFDLVISQGAIHYIDRKDRAIEEIWRILKPGGSAFLHIDSWMAPMPDFLDHATPRFTIYRDGERIPVRRWIEETAARGFAISYTEVTHLSTSQLLRLQRNRPEALQLGLAFDPLASFDLEALNRERSRWTVYWGYRSVYTAAADGCPVFEV